MRNNKGFSMIELIVSFSITTVIVVMLLQIVLVLKDVYTKSSIKTALLNKQNIIVNLIYTDILDNELSSVTSCGDYCAIFTFNNIGTKRLSSSDNIISYGDYTAELVGGSTIGKISLVTSTEDSVIYVNLPITHKLFNNKDFGIRIVHYLHE